jgi:hypothetical protein
MTLDLSASKAFGPFSKLSNPHPANTLQNLFSFHSDILTL